MNTKLIKRKIANKQNDIDDVPVDTALLICNLEL